MNPSENCLLFFPCLTPDLKRLLSCSLDHNFRTHRLLQCGLNGDEAQAWRLAVGLTRCPSITMTARRDTKHSTRPHQHKRFLTTLHWQHGRLLILDSNRKIHVLAGHQRVRRHHILDVHQFQARLEVHLNYENGLLPRLSRCASFAPKNQRQHFDMFMRPKLWPISKT